MVPRGIEVLVKKAALDAGFRSALLASPVAAAESIGLGLGRTEVALLGAVRREQLENVIEHTHVDPRLHSVLMGSEGGPMLAALERCSHRYEVPCSVVGAIADPVGGLTGWALLAAALGAAALPLVLAWRWIRRRKRRKGK
jgi:hypothetical protein